MASNARRNRWSALWPVSLLTALLALCTVTHASRTYAGINGQQVKLSCPGMKQMKVKGSNNQGATSVWDQPVVDVGTTTNWWWKGDVDINWKDSQGGWHGSSCNVPTFQFGSDTVECKCGG